MAPFRTPRASAGPWRRPSCRRPAGWAPAARRLDARGWRARAAAAGRMGTADAVVADLDHGLPLVGDGPDRDDVRGRVLDDVRERLRDGEVERGLLLRLEPRREVDLELDRD